ncbi:peroxiredoxin [Christiangramia salexigens]|uniref:thioredoxin-dependent peroxiredoxin n=1 Tax=Christiangramia salexigens TaxID=1913577 RepID=A0A1L3J4L5_9FLAO|nr:peroxiredoxin [Christiangramia salexigens]APG60050.1 peroxiredoxin [Christiangramia salexigens]
MEVGDRIPDITLKDQNGEDFNLDKLINNKALVVYFYPKNFTPGCTREACNFRDTYGKFIELGAEVIGISADSVESHARFKEKYDLPYTLLSDKGKIARKAFDVQSNLFGLLPGRETFIFSKGGKLLYKYNSMNATRHMPEALKQLKKNLE